MTTTCPTPGCETSYDCDACLDDHLREAHAASYREAFGPVPATWLGLCPQHLAVEPTRLGAIPTRSAAP